MSNKIVNKNTFDFDVGYIKESPCKTCGQRNRLPDCSKNCKQLAKIQEILTGKISCSNDILETEPYTFSF
jgi:hypothetical protein